jgi:hypothetical protein
VGLPRRSRAAFEGRQVCISSAEPMEEDLIAWADLPEGVEMEAFHNPVAREFLTLRLTATAHLTAIRF